jgi:putative transposase
VPSASAHALFNLSWLPVWWLRPERIERIRPEHHQQNGRHKRIHLTLKRKATKPAGLHFLQQPAQFEDFIDIFNKSAPSPSL